MWPSIKDAKHWRHDELAEFLASAKSSIRLISPYMRERTLWGVGLSIPEDTEVSVVCSWRREDLAQGFADPEIFTLCERNNWHLRVDTGHSGRRAGYGHDRRVHLKAYVVDDSRAMIGSANLTGMGMNSNIESLVTIDENHADWPRLFQSILEVGPNTRVADKDLYDYVRKYVEQAVHPHH